MIKRYTTPEMGELWSERKKYELWYTIERLVCEGWDKVLIAGKLNPPTVGEVEEVEKTTKHDVAAFIRVIARGLSPEEREWVHKGVTSSDIVDTAMAIRIRESIIIILSGLYNLQSTLYHIKRDYGDTRIMGRTHGQWGHKVKLSDKISAWEQQIKSIDPFLREVDKRVGGMISGPMGDHSQVPKEVELYVCDSLGLPVTRHTTQIVPREIYCHFLNTLAVLAATLEKIAVSIRLLSQTEVGEVSEGFTTGQVGSSSMSWKRNPIGSENICGLARLVRSNSMAMLESVAVWNENDISHSSVERVVIPDSCTLVHYMIRQMNHILSSLVFHTDRMEETIDPRG